MKINKYLYLVVFSVLIIVSCKNTAFNERPDYKEVMMVHDEAMAEMGTMHILGKDLESIKERNQDTDITQKIDEAIRKLHEADDIMMLWMQEFKEPENPDTYESYLLGEKDKVAKVNDAIFGAINKAKELIKEYGDQE